MKYYSEDEMKDVRTALEGVVLQWPDVKTKKMFGCPCYMVNGKLFMFLITKRIVFVKLSDEDREVLLRDPDSDLFRAGNRTMENWLTIPFHHENELPEIMHLIESSYETAAQIAD